MHLYVPVFRKVMKTHLQILAPSIERKDTNAHNYPQVIIYTTYTTALGLSFVWLVSLFLSTSMLKGSLVRQVVSLVAI